MRCSERDRCPHDVVLAHRSTLIREDPVLSDRTHASSTPVVAGVHGLTGVERLRRLRAAYGELQAHDLVERAVRLEFPGRVAVSSSFGTESAVLLSIVAEVDPCTPVLFLQTGMLFPETLHYAEQLAERLGLSNIWQVRPDGAMRRQVDPDNDLWITDPDKCCYVRKVRPFRMALRSFDCLMTGLKRAHGGVRGDVETIELEEGRIKLNPLARWTADDIARAFADRGLPRHPLQEKGYASIGCIPCTRPTRPGEAARAGRWDGRAKTECGIHARLHAAAEGTDGQPTASGTKEERGSAGPNVRDGVAEEVR